jgi:hypothetical protein
MKGSNGRNILVPHRGIDWRHCVELLPGKEVPEDLGGDEPASESGEWCHRERLEVRRGQVLQAIGGVVTKRELAVRQVLEAANTQSIRCLPDAVKLIALLGMAFELGQKSKARRWKNEGQRSSHADRN